MVPSQLTNLPDQEIFLLLKKNNRHIWEYIYDKYSPAIYGIICSITDDKVLAEKIFIDAFVEVKEKQVLLKISHSICVHLLRFTYQFAINKLKEYEVNPAVNYPVVPASLINFLCIQCGSIKEAASILNITEEEIKKKLRFEFLALRQVKENKMAIV